jgi:hypothetical protein
MLTWRREKRECIFVAPVKKGKENLMNKKKNPHVEKEED